MFLSLVSADEDFFSGNYTITMKKNSKITCITIDIIKDSVPEGSEFFTVKLRESALIELGSLPEAKITIVDDH